MVNIVNTHYLNVEKQPMLYGIVPTLLPRHFSLQWRVMWCKHLIFSTRTD